MTATVALAFHRPLPAATAPLKRGRVQRRITPEAGQALEILGHAIEYLADEYVREAGEFSAHDPRVQAVQLLMALNRQIYLGCPVKLSLGERLRILFSRSFN